MTHRIPPGTRDILPDEMRELRRLQGALAGRLRAVRLRRGGDADDRVPRGARARRRARRARRLPLLRRGRRAAGDALRHDDPDRAPGRDALRRRRAAVPVLLHRQRVPRDPPAARPDARVHAGRRRADRRGGAGGHRRGGRGAERGARRGRADPGGDRPRRRRPLPPAPRRARRRGRRARAHPRAARDARPRRARGRGRRARASGPASARRCCACRTCAAAPRCWTEARELGGAAVERATQRLAVDLRGPGGAGRRRAGQPRPRACSATSATTPGRSSRSTTRRSATCSAAAGATTS